MSRIVTCTHYAGPHDGTVINIRCEEYSEVAVRPFHVLETHNHGRSVYQLMDEAYEDEQVQVRQYRWVKNPPESYTYHE